jgi:HAD superfamily hydrolase (TIGR01509 family)
MPAAARTRAVLFDLGNTLVAYYVAADFARILRECLRGCIDVLALDARVEQEELLERALALNVDRPEHAVWPLAERLRVLFGDAVSDPRMLESVTQAFLRPIFAIAALDPEALPVLRTLRQRGIRTAIVSNLPWGSPAAAWRAELERHGLLAAVDAAVFCVDVGHRKPHPAPIERALELLKVAPGEAVFVGDDPRWDVAGAKRAGVRPILLSRLPTHEVDESVPVARDLRSVLEHIFERGA